SRDIFHVDVVRSETQVESLDDSSFECGELFLCAMEGGERSVVIVIRRTKSLVSLRTHAILLFPEPSLTVGADRLNNRSLSLFPRHARKVLHGFLLPLRLLN